MSDPVVVNDGRRTKVYPDPDPRKSGRIGYFCQYCGHEEICPRYGLPEVGFSLTEMTKGAQPRLVWVCSIDCLRMHVTALYHRNRRLSPTAAMPGS